MDSGVCVWLFISKFKGTMKKGIVKSRIQVGTFNSISMGVETVSSVLDLITTVKFDFFCSCFNEIKRTDVSKLFSIRCVICFVNYCSLKLTVSGPDGVLLTVQQIPVNAFCFTFFFSLCILLVQHSGASCKESIRRKVTY